MQVNESTVYRKTTERMKEKKMKFLSEIVPASAIVEKFEFWSDKFGQTIILELQKNGKVLTYKEFKI